MFVVHRIFPHFLLLMVLLLFLWKMCIRDRLNVDDDTSDDETSQEKEHVSEKRDFDHVTSFIEDRKSVV